MAVTQKILNRFDGLADAIKSTKVLTLNERDDYLEILFEAKEGTNGLTLEEKTQANSQNIFNLCYLFMRDKLEGSDGKSGLYRLIFLCRNQIVTLILGVVLIVCVLMGYRPQVIQLFDHLIPGR